VRPWWPKGAARGSVERIRGLFGVAQQDIKNVLASDALDPSAFPRLEEGVDPSDSSRMPVTSTPRPRSGRVFRALVLALVMAATFGALTLQIHRHPLISPMDEVADGDYLYRAAHFGFVHQGQGIGPEMAREIVCRGGIEIRLELKTKGCPKPGQTAPRRTEVNSADVHPPGYFWLTAVGARAFVATGVTSSLLTGGRLVNGLWLAFGVALIYLVMSDLGARLSTRWAISLLLGVSPGLLYVSRSVNPSAAALATGALIALAVVRWESGRWRLPVLLGVTALVPWIMVNSLLAIAVASLYLTIRAVVARRDAQRRRAGVLVVVAGLTAAAGVASQLGWLALRQAVSVSAAAVPQSTQFAIDHLTVDHVVTDMGSLVFPPNAHGNLPGTVGYLTGWLLLGGCIGAVFFHRSTEAAHGWGLATLVMLLLAGPLMVLEFYFGQGQYFPLPARYGIPMIAFSATALGRASRNAIADGLVFLLAVAALAVDLLVVGY
jgi:hypothetical protein